METIAVVIKNSTYGLLDKTYLTPKNPRAT